MAGLFGRLFKRASGADGHATCPAEVGARVDALYSALGSIYGKDKLLSKASRLDALEYMKSADISERIAALKRLVFEDPTIGAASAASAASEALDEIEEKVADIAARRSIEERLEEKIAEKIRERHIEYVREICTEVLREEAGADNAQTLRKYANLMKCEGRKLTQSTWEMLRPTAISEVIGQDAAVKALFSKIACPYPQHVILYGPPGVGKTSVARLALEYAKGLEYTPFQSDAPFVEVDGTTLRWDPREASNPLLGSVHDPIYQGARRDLADHGVPEPKPGLVTEASGGVLFIDEIGELDTMLLSKLLKVLEDKRVRFESSYYDPTDPNIPLYIRTLFEDGAPADFILIGATTRQPAEISPAIRSRCAEVYFQPLDARDIQRIVAQAASKLGAELEPGVGELISEYTIEGRKATRILADAYGVALYTHGKGAFASGLSTASTAAQDAHAKGAESRTSITLDDVREVIRVSRLAPFSISRASDRAEVGKVFGLGVHGFLGSVIEFEAVAFPASERGKGTLRFNETAGSMVRDSVFNATSAFRKVTGEDIRNYDIHVNVVGGGNIDGPSAGVAILVSMISAVTGRKVRQDVAVTGEVSIQARVKPVGGVPEKLHGAKHAGIRRVIVPKGNLADLPYVSGIEVIGVESVEEALTAVFEGTQQRE